MNVLENKVTIFRNVFDKDNPMYITVEQALNRIREGRQRETVELVRSGNKEVKTKLPVVLWSGVFTKREDDQLTDHSGLIVIDIDHINKFATVEDVKTLLCFDEYTLAVWESPSGDGIKCLVQITNPERHRDHFRALEVYFDKKYGITIDSSGKNESRACFESFDETMCVKQGKPFGNLVTQDYKEPKQQLKTITDSTDYQKLNVAALMIRRAQPGEKHATLLRASILCGGFISAGRIEEDEAYRVLLREIEKHDIESVESAKKTICDGIEEGKRKPIHEVIEQEEKEKRRFQIEDGDMSFISSDDTDEEWISAFAEGRIEMGLTTGHKEIDSHFVYKKEFVIINGHSNIGKTTAALHLMVNASMRHGWKWIIYSAENKTASIKMKLMQFACDTDIKHLGYAARRDAYAWVKKHFILIKNDRVFSYTDILMYMEKVMSYQKVDGIFIDPYNSLRVDIGKNNGAGVHEYHYDAASEFLTFSNSRNVALWLNMHAVTEAARRKGEDGLPTAPNAEDSEHGGKWVNRCDTFLTFHRKIQHPIPQMRRTMEWHVRKVRETETGGEPTSVTNPIMLEMNITRTSFRTGMGVPLYPPLGAQVTESLSSHIPIIGDISIAF
jgi:hypothetical protein